MNSIYFYLHRANEFLFHTNFRRITSATNLDSTDEKINNRFLLNPVTFQNKSEHTAWNKVRSKIGAQTKLSSICQISSKLGVAELSHCISDSNSKIYETGESDR